MKANELIIDEVDFIETFYHGVKEDPDKEMYIQHDDEWSKVKEFGYTKIACDWLDDRLDDNIYEHARGQL